MTTVSIAYYYSRPTQIGSDYLVDIIMKMAHFHCYFICSP